ncbi:hypothetical protein TrCOL_g11240 [Triparma columacea]|uniref:Uncharacterized protein n=1 Tax=Triparma columacea TaxID=722753 RepID=A0A9W7GPQ9_9STRA|nr:hypothetical protein TrCOL_g11240 [Triparma columacea]
MFVNDTSSTSIMTKRVKIILALVALCACAFLLMTIDNRLVNDVTMISTDLRGRMCPWSPENDQECMDLIQPLLTACTDRRTLFLGDSTVGRLWGQLPGRAPSADIRTERCNWLQSFGINKSKVWSAPPSDAGPVGHGLEHHWCTDCQGCNSFYYTRQRGTSGTNSYIAVEFAKDVEMQSVLGNTTQETLVRFLKAHLNHDVCVVNSGIHDQAILNLTTSQYVANVNAYLKGLHTVCSHLVWIDTTAPATDNYHQKLNKTLVWNRAVNGMILKDFHDVYIVGVGGASVHWPHVDNVHLDAAWYSALAKLFQ